MGPAISRSIMMFFACLLLAAGAASAQPALPSQSRGVLILDAGWRFTRGDPPNAQAPDLDDKDWTKTTLPHSFDAAEEGDGNYYRGPAWYRREVMVAAPRPGRRLFLQFDGAATIADIWLNGKRVGRHEGGHAAFRFDITDALVPGRNLLAVRVDNGATRRVAPLGGDFTIFGGLYRPVSLIETDDLHFDMMDFGGPGIYARADRIEAGSAAISLTARISNASNTRRRVRVSSRVLDAEGREVAVLSGSVNVPAKGTEPLVLRGTIAAPRLWDGVRDPYLYRVVARIGPAGDEVTVPLGIRTFRIDPADGFILNGKPYPLRGANLQLNARPGIGTAVSRAQVAEDLAILREMGSTGVRFAHFQHPQAAYDEADRLGLGVWTEVGVVAEIEDTPEFRANAAQQLRELIAQTYNHPSVMVWGLGNEVYADDPRVARVLTELQQVAKQADPSRPTAYAHCCQADDHPKAMVSDVIGFNRYFGWYKDQNGQTLGGWASGFHAAHGTRAFAISEYGAGASIVHQADPPGPVEPASGWHPEQYQTDYHERNWLEIADKPYIFASFVWVAFDFASAGRHEGDRRGINDKGLVTYDRRTRKDAYYWYQANWSAEPMVHITSRRLDLRRQPEAEVKAYTNGDSATLLLNGVEVGTLAPRDRIAKWKVKLREGANRIEVRANGRSDSVEWRYEPAPAMIASDR
ncbi:MAG: glycoside hydrolase family 2 protein [Sphingomonas sp.]|uniref:glycoside hydrolase family 2 protein n=1 Tax=Sphingomonas sp. TaxID=28214 RepID=UPI0022725613|nr:glycoside hydrolase family 2 TIM barrel-domain containing protein [Sphingomonas sp.]MCX8477154.1 glycoside hydrolase family 2 protein [Sphingomonas sp.]